jgi:hypothetical protein
MLHCLAFCVLATHTFLFLFAGFSPSPQLLQYGRDPTFIFKTEKIVHSVRIRLECLLVCAVIR